MCIAIKTPENYFPNKAVSIGNKILVIHSDAQSIASYNVDKDEWSEELYDSIERYGENIRFFKLPQTTTEIDESEKEAEKLPLAETGAAEMQQNTQAENFEISDIKNNEQVVRTQTIPITETTEIQENSGTENFEIPAKKRKF